jgi:hypothetical protein
MPPTMTNGKICYIEIPAVDIDRSSEFYAKVFGWPLRKRGDGHLAFDDGAGEVSGTWVTGRPPSSQPGLLIYIMVDDVAATVETIIAEVKPDQPLAGETQALWNVYERAVIDSSVYQRWYVRPLRPLTPDEHGQVLVAMVTSKDGKVGDTMTAGTYGMWVTGVPEVQTICRAFRGDVTMQLRQLLGLPPDADAPRVLVLEVAATDLFRPAPDDNTNTPLPCKTCRIPPSPPTAETPSRR